MQILPGISLAQGLPRREQGEAVGKLTTGRKGRSTPPCQRSRAQTDEFREKDATKNRVSEIRERDTRYDTKTHRDRANLRGLCKTVQHSATTSRKKDAYCSDNREAYVQFLRDRDLRVNDVPIVTNVHSEHERHSDANFREIDAENGIRVRTVYDRNAAVPIVNSVNDRVPGLPRIQVQLENRPHRALLDTGATHNLIRAQTGNITDGTELFLGDGTTTIKAQGPFYLDLHVEDVQQKTKFHATATLREEVILGQDWLIANDAVIDTKMKCVHFGSHQRKTAYFVGTPAEKTVPLPRIENGFPAPLQNTFEHMISDFRNVFDETAQNRTKTDNHTIRLRSNKPINIRPYRYSAEKKKIISEQIQEMLSQGVITPSTSEYNSPIVIVKKKDGRDRFCVDFRKLNDATESEAAVLPVIQETLADMGNASIFSTIDLKSGYWQVPLNVESRKYTAFTAPDGSSFEFRVMPFGLKNAPATFQKLMTRVLAGYLHLFTAVYLDDIIIYSKNMEEHLYHLRLVFERLQQNQLSCAIDKCRFGVSDLPFLGHRLTRTGSAPLPEHIQHLQNAAVPRTRKELRSFVGTLNWIRDYVPKCAELISPLTDLLKTNRRYTWNSSAGEAFQKIKDAISKPLELDRPDFSQPFFVQTDASGKGIAAVLFQMDNGKRRIITYGSAKLTATEQRYHVNEQECLAVVWALRRYRSFLEGQHFTLVTDSRSLLWLNATKDSRAKLTRWALLLQEFDFETVHCPGTNNELADALSRNPSDHTTASLPTSDRLLPPEHEQTFAEEPPAMNTLETATIVDTVLEAQQADPEIQAKITRWLHLSATGPATTSERKLMNEYIVEDGILRRRINGRCPLVVPVNAREKVLYAVHDSIDAGHPGAEETTRQLERRFYFLQMRNYVRRYVSSCSICASCKRGTLQSKAPLRPRPPARPWETISIDAMGPYPATAFGNRFILVASDLYSRWIEAIACSEAKTNLITRFLENEIFARYGYPRNIISDNGRQFLSNEFELKLQEWNAEHYTTPVYTPRANPVERRNQELKKGLRILANTTDNEWDENLPLVLHQLRARKNAATGFSPSEALFGKDPVPAGGWKDEQTIPQAVTTTTEERVTSAARAERKYKTRYQDNSSPPPAFTTGDSVYVRRQGTKPAFSTTWEGPFEILKAESATVYWVDRRHGPPTKYYINDIRLSHTLRD